MSTLELFIVGNIVENKIKGISWRSALKTCPHLVSFCGHHFPNAVNDSDKNNELIHIYDKTSCKAMLEYEKSTRKLSFHVTGKTMECTSVIKQFNEVRKEPVTSWNSLEDILRHFAGKKTIRAYISPTRLAFVLRLANKIGFNVSIEVRKLSTDVKKTPYLKNDTNIGSIILSEGKKWTTMKTPHTKYALIYLLQTTPITQ